MRYEAFLAYTIVGMLISLAVYSILPYAVGSQLVALSQYAGWLSYTLLLIICAVPLILWMRNRHHRRED
jgi:membrane protein DedA with SNARE-associated domain